MADLLLLASEASACGAFKLKIMDSKNLIQQLLCFLRVGDRWCFAHFGCVALGVAFVRMQARVQTMLNDLLYLTINAWNKLETVQHVEVIRHVSTAILMGVLMGRFVATVQAAGDVMLMLPEQWNSGCHCFLQTFSHT